MNKETVEILDSNFAYYATVKSGIYTGLLPPVYVNITKGKNLNKKTWPKMQLDAK